MMVGILCYGEIGKVIERVYQDFPEHEIKIRILKEMII